MFVFIFLIGSISYCFFGWINKRFLCLRFLSPFIKLIFIERFAQTFFCTKYYHQSLPKRVFIFIIMIIIVVIVGSKHNFVSFLVSSVHHPTFIAIEFVLQHNLFFYHFRLVFSLIFICGISHANNQSITFGMIGLIWADETENNHNNWLTFDDE